MKQAFQKVIEKIHYIKAIEVSLIGLALWWTFLLALPLNTFGSSNAYQAMEKIAPEGVWALIFFIIAIISIHGSVTEHKITHMSGLFLSAGAWFFVATMFAMGNVITTATGTYFIIACLNAFVYYKAGEKHGR